MIALRPAGNSASCSARAGYPSAHRLDLVEELHGRQIADPYRWLETADSTETREWMAAQEGLFSSISSTWESQPEFAARIAELLGTGDIGLPRFRGRRCFYTRRAPDGELPVLYVRVESDEATELGPADERVLVDPLALDPAGTTTLDSWSPSPSGALVAVQLSAGGTEDSDLLVLDVETGATLDGPIDRCRFSSIGWLADESGFYYVRRQDPSGLPDDEAAYHRRVRLRRFGRQPDEDSVVFGEGRDKASIFSADTDPSG
ncbi:MAG: S9 family peptidase, partial [Actinomycetota bacterium]|nr:S9 family peptidase [Actinomycetota bacterium]